MPILFNQTAFAADVKARREVSNLGLREAAEQIGNISASTISRIENGKTPDMTDFLSICAWLGKEPNEFLGSDDLAPYPTRERVRLALAQDGRISHEIIMAIDAIIKLATENKDG